MVDTRDHRNLPDEVVARILADIAKHRPGLWAESASDGPACTCALQDSSALSTGKAFGGKHHGCARHRPAL